MKMYFSFNAKNHKFHKSINSITSQIIDYLWISCHDDVFSNCQVFVTGVSTGLTTTVSGPTTMWAG